MQVFLGNGFCYLLSFRTVCFSVKYVSFGLGLITVIGGSVFGAFVRYGGRQMA